jgi:sulfate permease, SulP family
MGALPTTLPFFAMPAVPFSWETLRIIFPTAPRWRSSASSSRC